MVTDIKTKCSFNQGGIMRREIIDGLETFIACRGCGNCLAIQKQEGGSFAIINTNPDFDQNGKISLNLENLRHLDESFQKGSWGPEAFSLWGFQINQHGNQMEFHPCNKGTPLIATMGEWHRFYEAGHSGKFGEFITEKQ